MKIKTMVQNEHLRLGILRLINRDFVQIDR